MTNMYTFCSADMFDRYGISIRFGLIATLHCLDKDVAFETRMLGFPKYSSGMQAHGSSQNYIKKIAWVQ